MFKLLFRFKILIFFCIKIRKEMLLKFCETPERAPCEEDEHCHPQRYRYQQPSRQLQIFRENENDEKYSEEKPSQHPCDQKDPVTCVLFPKFGKPVHIFRTVCHKPDQKRRSYHQCNDSVYHHDQPVAEK